MPEAVTTQGETFWIGVNRSAMMRVPYVVSSPEIADPVQPIDATNLASDARVYIPGIKDYSGDLVWEANSQRYLPGELRDLLAMDGCHVWAERRMPMVGMRVSVEGEASVSLSAADPDGVQRVTVRIAPTAPMSVEEWSPDMSDGYLYRIRTDSETRMNILHVSAAYGGRELAQVVTRYTRRQGAANIPHEWDWNGGVGPFGCWYGAFNVDAYVAGSESEEPVCTEAGRLAYRLDPFNLKRTLAGTVLTRKYNTFLVIPTVYWRVTGDDLYLSSSPSYRGVSSMVPYAHTATLPGGGTKVYPYIGIGVYEATSTGKLLSLSGYSPAGSQNYEWFRSRVNNASPAAGCAFQMWTFSQWTLFKAMCYAVMGTKNSQWMLGDGPTSGGSRVTTGQADLAGPYADSTSQYDKLFIENAWGGSWGFLGDTMWRDCVLCADQTLGGAALGGQTSTGASVPNVNGNAWVQTVGNGSPAWDLPATAGSTDTSSDPAATGDKIYSSSGDLCVLVGGSTTEGTGAGLANIRGAVLNVTNPNFGGRISYFLDDYAVGLTDEAPASLSMAPLTLTMGQSTPDEEEAEESEEESAEPTEEPAEEQEETPEESEDEPEEDMR